MLRSGPAGSSSANDGSGKLIGSGIAFSELKSPALESKLVNRTRRFEFASTCANVTEASSLVDFLPSCIDGDQVARMVCGHQIADTACA